MNIDLYTAQEIRQGYTYEEATESFSCLACEKKFYTGEIYEIFGRFYEAKRAVCIHMRNEHPDYTKQLIKAEIKYNALTENQRELMCFFAEGISDQEIAKIQGVAASTVRHQKFVFREKAKQAKMYLAIYEAAIGAKMEGESKIMSIHDSATMVDERYVITEKERDDTLCNMFSSLSPLRLKSFPRKEKKKIIVLTKISELFTKDVEYSEKEVNKMLKSVYADYVTIRRFLVDYGFVRRTRDGKTYWLA